MGGVGREAQSSGCDSGGRGDISWMIFMSNCSVLEIKRFDVSHPFRNEPTSKICKGVFAGNVKLLYLLLMSNE
jgi:hypothetical protein